MTRRAAIAAAALGLGLGAAPACGLDAPLGVITAVTFNVAGADRITDPVVGPRIAGQLAALAPDVAALQECVRCAELVAMLPVQYRLVGGAAAVAIVFDGDRWELDDDGVIPLGTNDDGWGRRDAQWARLRERGGRGAVDVYATHWCVPIRRADDECDGRRHLEYARAIAAHLDRRDAPAAIVGGDLNLFEEPLDSAALRYLLDQGLVDTHAASGDPGATTFHGNTWAPPARLDYLLATDPVAVLEAWIDRSIAPGEGSDHDPVVARITFRAGP